MNRLVVCILAVCLMNPLLNAQKTTSENETPKQNTTSNSKKKSSTSSESNGTSKSTSTSSKKQTPKTSNSKKVDPKKPWISIANKALKKKVAGMTKKLKTPEKRKLLKFLNDGKRDDLIKVPGIGKSRAENLTKGRPYKAVDEIIDITGIGETTFGNVIAYVEKL